MKRLAKVAWDMARNLVAWVDVKREGDPTDRKVQCEGERDETETGREIFREACHLNPGGYKHRARAGGKGLLLRILDGILIGVVDDENAPTNLNEGETAMFSPADAAGKSCVKCTTTRIEIGSGPGGLMIRKDRFETWWNATPAVNYLAHGHTGSMPGPGTTGAPNNTIGSVGTIECDEDHRVR